MSVYATATSAEITARGMARRAHRFVPATPWILLGRTISRGSASVVDNGLRYAE